MYIWTYIWDIVCGHLSWIVSQNILVKPTCSPLHLWYLAQEYVRIYHHCVLMVFGCNYIPSTVYNFPYYVFQFFLLIKISSRCFFTSYHVWQWKQLSFAVEFGQYFDQLSSALYALGSYLVVNQYMWYPTRKNHLYLQYAL